MNTYGYIRVSTREQNEDRQVIAMTEFGVEEDNIGVEEDNIMQQLGYTFDVEKSTVSFISAFLHPALI